MPVTENRSESSGHDSVDSTEFQNTLNPRCWVDVDLQQDTELFSIKEQVGRADNSQVVNSTFHQLVKDH